MKKNGERRLLRLDEKLWLKINEQMECARTFHVFRIETNGGTNNKSQKIVNNKDKK